MREKIALSFLKGLGPVRISSALSKLESIQYFFELPMRELQFLTGLSQHQLVAMDRQGALHSAEKELELCQKFSITPLFYQDDNYPRRLRQCPDAPVVLYQKGNTDLNARRLMAVVGTRNLTEYGREIATDLIAGLVQANPVVVSGLALGVDAVAHKTSLKHQLPTVGVLGNGLHEVFPKRNEALAEEMLASGGALVSEYPYFAPAVRENFPVRNRIVAGLSDATVVVESKERGGSLITAEFANDYNRDVFAFPGSVKQKNSAGCNNLIRQQKAHLITGAEDFIAMMGWATPTKTLQQVLLPEFTPEESEVLQVLKRYDALYLDELAEQCAIPTSMLMGLLLTLQLKGGILNHGGGRYSAN